jgi:hypothetical protein
LYDLAELVLSPVLKSGVTSNKHTTTFPPDFYQVGIFIYFFYQELNELSILKFTATL